LISPLYIVDSAYKIIFIKSFLDKVEIELRERGIPLSVMRKV